MNMIENEKEENIKTQPVLFTNHSNSVEEIILNNPAKLNVVNLEMTSRIFNRIKNYVEESKLIKEGINLELENKLLIHLDGSKKNKKSENKINPKVVILTGQGDKSFCAGGDITALYNQMKNKEINKILEFYKYEIYSDICFDIMDPVLISIWNGYAMGGGLGLSVNAPIRIATDNTIFAMPETGIGLYPDVGGAYFLTRIFNNIPEIGLYCGLVGYRVEGVDCTISGAATHFVKKENLEKMKDAVINYFNINKNINSDKTILLDNITKIISSFSEYIYTPETFKFPNEDLIKEIFKFDSIYKIFDRLEEMIYKLYKIKNSMSTGINNDENNFNDPSLDFSLNFSLNYNEETLAWAESTLNKLNSVSPLSLLIFFEFAKRALNYTNICQVYQIDTKLFSNIVSLDKNDFMEGVRALLIAKDKNPKWTYKSIRDIENPESVIKQFFEDEMINKK